MISLFFFSDLYSQSKPYWDQIPEDVAERNSYKRFEWFYAQRAYPFDTLHVQQYFELMKSEKAKSNSKQGNAIQDLTWEAIGPQGLYINSHPQWGFLSGRIRALAVHPSNPDVVYIGAASGGIWSTSDGGENWSDIASDLPSLTYGAIAIDPNNPEVVYAGAGESMKNFNMTMYDGKGMYKSVDAGANWTLINDFGTQTHFSAIKVSPYNSDIVFAALGSGNWHNSDPGNEGIWRSSDAGSSWTRVLNQDDAFDVLPDINDQNRIYAVANSSFYISNDFGLTWNSITMGGGISKSRVQIAMTPANTQIIYALVYGAVSNVNKITVFKSEDRGETWALVSDTWDSSQGWYDLMIAVNPANENEIYIGHNELRRSTDGGINFPYVGGPYHDQAMHVDFHHMVFAPSNPDIRYVVSDGGIWRSDDAGSTWESRNIGLQTIQYYRIAAHPNDPNIIFGGAQDNCNYRTTDGGLSWETVTFADGMQGFVDHTSPNFVYVSHQYGSLYRSSSGGDYNTFQNITPPKDNQPAAWVAPYFMHPWDNNTIFTATDRPWKSTNKGSSWTPLTSSGFGSSIQTMAISPINDLNMIFAVGSYDNTPQVYVSSDGGNNWSSVTSNIPGNQRYISRVVCDPFSGNTIYVVRSGYGSGKIYKSTDFGGTWTDISGNLPDIPHNDLFIDPEIPGQYYAANDFGVYCSVDFGGSWQRMDNGIPFVPAMDFDYVNYGDTRVLYCGTHGRSAFKMTLQDPNVKYLLLAVPNGNENWVYGTTESVKWACNLIDNLTLEYSINNGTDWMLISDSPDPASCVFEWEIPDVESDQCLVRISDVDKGIVQISESVFSILPLRKPVNDFPADNSTGVPVSTEFSWNSVLGADSYDLEISDEINFTNIILFESDILENVFSVQNLNTNTTYYWRVKSKNVGSESDFSIPFNLLTVLDTPNLLSPENNARDQAVDITLIWDSVEDAETYNLQISKSAAFTNLELDETDITSTQFAVSGLENTARYYWRVKAFNDVNLSEFSGNWKFFTQDVTGIDEAFNSIPEDYKLFPNYPNPFNPTTTIRIGLPEVSQVNMTIYNLAGEKVFEITKNSLNQGYHEMIWNAENVPSGVYLVKISSYSLSSDKKFNESIKVTLLK